MLGVGCWVLGVDVLVDVDVVVNVRVIVIVNVIVSVHSQYWPLRRGTPP